MGEREGCSEARSPGDQGEEGVTTSRNTLLQKPFRTRCPSLLLPSSLSNKPEKYRASGEEGGGDERESQSEKSQPLPPALTKLPHLYPKPQLDCAAVWYLHQRTHLVPYSHQQCKIHHNSWPRIFCFRKYGNIIIIYKLCQLQQRLLQENISLLKIFHSLLG